MYLRWWQRLIRVWMQMRAGWNRTPWRRAPWRPQFDCLEARVVPANSQVILISPIYHELLGRSPSGGENGSSGTFLQNGGTAAQMSLQITGTMEYQGDVVTSGYHQVLGRAPEATGL